MQTFGKITMGLLYIAAGTLHFLVTRTYTNIMPDYLPAHRELVLLSGAAEIAGGLGILIPRTQRAAAWGLILLLIVVMPANIWMVQHPERYPGIPLWALWLRLPLQLPLIYWAWRYTKTSPPKRTRLSSLGAGKLEAGSSSSNRKPSRTTDNGRA